MRYKLKDFFGSRIGTVEKTLRIIFVCSVFSSVALSVCQALEPTVITSDGTLGTGVTTRGTIHDITGGTRPGDGLNLFHSFGQFSVGENNIANFLNDTGKPTSNILSRVTGGDPSKIFGTVQSTGFPDANFFLINPAGIVFGPSASLNVGAGFHASTADFIRLGTDGIFYASIGKESVLTVSPPESFGFLKANPQGITIDGSTLEISDDNTLSFVGGDIKISSGILAAPNGQISLVSVASPSEVGIGRGSDLQIDAPKLGSIELAGGANIQAFGESGGAVVIRSGQLVIDESKVATSRTGPPEESLKGSSKAEIDIQVANDFVIDNGSILDLSVLAKPAGLPNPDRINIDAGHLEIGMGSMIQSSVLPDSPIGHGGDVLLKANSILLRDEASQVITNAGGSASGGDIKVEVTGEIALNGSSILQTYASDETTGNAGDIHVTADKISINQTFFDGPPPFFIAGLSSLTEGKGNAGDIIIETNALQMNGGFISTFTTAEGNAGNMEISVNGDFSLIGDDPTVSGNVVSNTFGAGNAGAVLIRANNLLMTNDVQIQSATAGSGNGSLVDIRLNGNLVVEDRSSIDSFTTSSGAAGNLNITAKDIFIKGLADAEDPTASDFRTGLSVASNPGTGPAGNLTIVADSLQVKDQGSISSITKGAGDGGNINITVEELSLLNGATVNAQSIPGSDGAANAGNAGNVNIATGSMVMESGAQINSSTSTNGMGGNVSVSATDAISISGMLKDGISSGVFSRTTGTEAGSGAGGTISLTAGQNFTLSNGATVSVSSEGPANAGNINVTANDTILIDKATVTTEAALASGGNITLTANDMIQLVDSTIASSVQGNANTAGGDVTLDPDFIILQNSQILAKAVQGQGGNISLVANDVVLVDQFSVLDASSALGISGSVNIQAPTKFLSGTIAPLPQNTAPVTALYGSRCVAGAGGHFSTFVDSKADSLAPTPGTFLASPFFPLSSSTQARALGHAGTYTGHSEAGHAAPLQVAAYSPPVLFGQGNEMLSACP